MKSQRYFIFFPKRIGRWCKADAFHTVAEMGQTHGGWDRAGIRGQEFFPNCIEKIEYYL